MEREGNSMRKPFFCVCVCSFVPLFVILMLFLQLVCLPFALSELLETCGFMEINFGVVLHGVGVSVCSFVLLFVILVFFLQLLLLPSTLSVGVSSYSLTEMHYGIIAQQNGMDCCRELGQDCWVARTECSGMDCCRELGQDCWVARTECSGS